MSRASTRALAGALALLATALAPAAAARDLVGSRFKVKGEYREGAVVATRIEWRDPRRDPERGRVEGPLASVRPDGTGFAVGPVEVELTPGTRVSGLGPGGLVPGARVEVTGRLVRADRLRAEEVEVGEGDGDGTVELLGAVGRAEAAGAGALRLWILGVPVLARREAVPRAAALTRNLDDRRPAEQLHLDLLGRPLTVGGELSSRLSFEEDPGLEEEEGDDAASVEEELQLELFWRLSPSLSVFAEGKASHEREIFAEGSAGDEESGFERGETWLYLAPLLDLPVDLSLQIGRQRFQEEREWWWDADLDAVRLYLERFPWAAELGFAREVASVSTAVEGIEPEEEGIWRLLAHATWDPLPGQRLSLYGLLHRDRSSRPAPGRRLPEDREDPSDSDLLWVGARATGELALGAFGELDYWVGGALVRGDETLFRFREAARDLEVRDRRRREVRGFGGDLGATWELPLPLSPRLTLGYAAGSGDRDPDDGRDGAFRQTGLQDNNGRFRGVDRFRYYGELLDPELSNLHVLTAALGFPLLGSSSIEVVYHLYRQDEPAPFLRDAKLDADPLGRRRGLGQELDLVVGLEEWEHVEIELVLSAFRAGPAFGPRAGELATGGFLKLDLNF